MPSNRFRSLVAALMGLALLISACSGDDNASGDEPGAVDTDANVEPSALDGVDPFLPDLSGPVDPESVTSLVSALTGVEPAAEELTCLTDIAEDDSLLTEVFNGFGTQGYVLEPEGFTALTVNTHECVANETLVNSLTSLSALEGEGNDAFLACIETRINDETNGDLAYTGLSALLVQFEIPEGSVEFALDAVTECVTPEDLAEQLSFQTESLQGFSVEVDRECVVDGLDEETVTAFWTSFMLNQGDGSESRTLIESCTSSFNSDLAQELPADFEPWAGVSALSGVDPFIRNGVYSEAPPLLLEDGVDYQAVLTTTDGEFTIDLFEETAPITVNNFVALARDGYYDATIFHRVLEGFMAQGGDPTGTGTGGPGYSFDDEQSALTDIDRRGLLAMANSGPNTNGSQFFITFEPADFLNGMHAVFGEVLDGDDIFAQVDLRDPEQPTNRGEQIISVVITEN